MKVHSRNLHFHGSWYLDEAIFVAMILRIPFAACHRHFDVTVCGVISTYCWYIIGVTYFISIIVDR